MIITSSNLNLSSTRQASTEITRRETLDVRGDLNQAARAMGELPQGARVELQASSRLLSRQLSSVNMAIGSRQLGEDSRMEPPGQQLRRLMGEQDGVSVSDEAQRLQPQRRVGRAEERIDGDTNGRLSVLKAAVEKLTGKQIDVFDSADLEGRRPRLDSADLGGAPPRAEGAEFSIEYNFYEKRVESEDTSFSAKGVVRTADNKEIDIDVQLNMSRSFMEEQDINIRISNEPRMKDPLVVNFDGNAAELSSTKFSFDIDSDGEADQISTLSSNSAFLALDKNEDGVINDGSELFGATSGNGFADLSEYDEDGNQWIDENDSIYSKLRVWSPDENGESQLIALGDKDVGAIYLGNVSTQFSLNDIDTNETNGEVVSTSLFLKDSGGAGTVQQLNLVV